MNILKIISAAVCGFTFIFLAASTGGPNWVDFGVDSPLSKYIKSAGIFRSCFKKLITGKAICDNVPESAITGKLKTIRAFAVLSVLASVAGIALAVVGMFVDKISLIIGSIAMAGAGLFALIAGAIYADETGESVKMSDGVTYGWSFMLCWVGMVTAFISAALGFLVHLKEKKDLKFENL